MSKRFRFIAVPGIALLALALSHCTSYRQMPPPPPSESAYAPARRSADVSEAPASQKPSERPGLGTQLGDDLYRQLAAPTQFYRRSRSIPDAVATFHYNDAEGAKLMAEMTGRPIKRGGSFELIPGKLRVALVPRFGGGSYDHFQSGGKFFVICVPGNHYELRVENVTRTPMEVVISIDGLDVLDGQPASVSKRGYLVAPRSTVSIEGMRVGGRLKSLIFSSVAISRAATAFGEGGARNVGVIGVACYEEDEAARRRARIEENYLRGDAKPFGR